MDFSNLEESILFYFHGGMIHSFQNTLFIIMPILIKQSLFLRNIQNPPENPEIPENPVNRQTYSGTSNFLPV